MDSQNTDSPEQTGLALTAGGRLRSAREAAGLTRADISSQTKIAERHLCAIEEDRFGDMAARTYAVGFARAYARALGLDEAEIAAAVHAQIDGQENNRPEVVPHFEPGDPARVPPVRLAWLAAGGAVVVIVLLLAFWGSFLSPEGKLPDLLPQETPASVASVAASPSAPAPAATGGPVVLTSADDGIWIRVTDADGKALLEKNLAKGESWTVPADAKGPQLRTGRLDALQFSVGGKPVPPLAARAQTVSGLPLTGPELIARSAAATAPSAAQGAASQGGTPNSGSTPQPSRVPAANRATPSAPQALPSRAATPAPSAPATPRTAPAASPRPAATPTARASTVPGTRATATATPKPSAVHSSAPAAAAPSAPEPAAPQTNRAAEPLSTVSE